MSELTLYHNPMSRGRIAHWMLEEIGVPYTVKLLDFEKQEHKSAAYLAINPMGKVPTIVHGKTVVTEAAAVCAYLADAFPAAKLAPAIDDPARGTYYRWLFFGAACVEPAVSDRAFGRPPVRASALGYGSYEDTIHALEQAVSQGDYILGDRFSAADVYVSSQLGWGMMTKGIDPRPAFQAYVERTNQRPAVKRMTEQNEKFAQQLKGR
jgi:glutathione S-transferase